MQCMSNDDTRLPKNEKNYQNKQIDLLPYIFKIRPFAFLNISDRNASLGK